MEISSHESTQITIQKRRHQEFDSWRISIHADDKTINSITIFGTGWGKDASLPEIEILPVQDFRKQKENTNA